MRKEITHEPRYDERDLHEPLPPQYLQINWRCRSSQTLMSPMRVMIRRRSTRKLTILKRQRNLFKSPTITNKSSVTSYRTYDLGSMKIFTVQEANALLPNVRIILAKIQGAHRKLTRYRDEAKKASEAAEQAAAELPKAPHMQSC